MLENAVDFIVKLLTDPVVLSAFFSWLLAQVIKSIIRKVKEKKDFWSDFFKSGGMPSSHIAPLVALTLSLLITTGLAAPFYISLMITFLFINDAVRSRYLIGQHSKILNKQIKGRKLEEHVGHTPLEALFGAFLGIIVVIIVFGIFALI